MTVDPSIFKAYDIRGTYPNQVNSDVSKRVAHAFTALLRSEVKKPLQVVVSRDMRLSSPELSEALIAGLVEAGVEVVDIGLASTPTFYYAVAKFGYHGGIQVSASHNPKEYNGFKMVRAGAVPISGDTGIMQIRDWAVAGHTEPTTQRGKVIHKTDVLEALVQDQRATAKLQALKPFKIVIDAANAMGAVDMQAFFADLPMDVVPLNFELDGTFPVHEADPLKMENLEQLQQAVVKASADLGIALDGDGDRIFLIMENGELLKPEILRGILAQIVLTSHPGKHIGFDIRPGKATRDMIEAAGGKPFVTKVGHSLIKEQMLAMESPFSGESSGHFFYQFPFGSFEAPMKMLSDFLLWFGQQDQPLSHLVAAYDKYVHSGEVNAVVQDMPAVFATLKQKYADANSIDELDGVTITYDTFWFNVRGSNTEPKVRLNLEAVDKTTMEKKRDEVFAVIKKAGG